MKRLKRFIPLLLGLVLAISICFAAACSGTEYTVTFDSNGGSAVESQSVVEGESAEEPEEPVYAGYEFDGWYLNGQAYDFSSAVTEDITLTAQWTAVYTVTFDSNGGTAVADQQVRDGETATEPTAPTNGENAFLGWYLNGRKYDFSTPVTSNITLVAVWNDGGQVEYTITFNSNGGSAVSSQQVAAGGNVAQPADPVYEGYAFDGWYYGDVLFNFDTVVTSNIILVARWTRAYTVTFDSNGGSEVEAQIVRTGQIATLPAEPTYLGREFLGWTLDGEEYDFLTPVTSDITLTASWSEGNNDMIVDMAIDTATAVTEFAIGDEFSAEGLSITATLYDEETLATREERVDITDPSVTIDSSEFDSTAAGTYTIYVGCTLGGLTRWQSYEVTVSSVISGVHGIELSKTVTEYEVAIDGDPAPIDLDDLTVNAVNEDGTLGAEITSGITYKYFLGAEEVTAEQLTTANARVFQIWAYVDYTVGNETYVMSDFVLVEVVGNLITAMSFAEGNTTQAQSYTNSMTSTWVFNAEYSLTGDATIDLSTATIGTGAGQYTVSGLYPAVTGNGTAVVTYYYQVGSEVLSATCEVPYTITGATEESTFSAVIDVNAGTADEADLPEATTVITSMADGDEIVAGMVYSNGLSGVNSENKAGANGEGKLYGRVQFGSTKGVTLYLGGPATITLYARYGSSSGTGSQFVLSSDGEEVARSAVLANSKAYEIVTVEVPAAGVYTLFASSGSLNTFRIEIEGTIVPDNMVTETFNVNDLTATDVGEYTANKALDDTFTIVAASGASVKIDDKTSDPVTVGGQSFNYAVNLGGSKKGSGNARSIMFTVTEAMVAEGPVTLTVYANHGGGAGSIRMLGIYADGKSSSSYIVSSAVDGGGAVVELTIDTAGTYYMGSQSSGINIYRIDLSYVPTIVTVDFNVNDLTATDVGEYTANKALDETFTIVAASGSTVKIDDKTSAPVTIEGQSYNYAVNLGGGKKPSGNTRSIMFTITEDMVAAGPVTLTVYANHGGGAGSIRTLGVYNDGGEKDEYVAGEDIDGAGAVVELTIEAAGTYYMGSAGSGMNIYQIILSYTSAGEGV